LQKGKVFLSLPSQKKNSVRKLKEYNLPFLGLKIGNHEYDFTLTKAFFEAFEYSEIEESNIAVTLKLEKQASMMILDFHLSGTVNVPCDRCGDQIAHPLVATYRLIVKFGQETGSTDDEVYILGPAEHEIDVSQFLYEYAHLSIPQKRAHARIEECNQEVLKALEKYRVEESADANWIALKNMEFEDNDPFLDFDEEGEEEE
jgi:uncharacterized metal-binding protein YceD (DUF177 family)